MRSGRNSIQLLYMGRAQPRPNASVANVEQRLRSAFTEAELDAVAGKSILDLAKASTSGAQQNYLCQTPLTSLSIIINLLRFGLETAVL